ncbi:hypothetical protein Hanom_Chr16g01484561 [Helianthus anomalus]
MYIRVEGSAKHFNQTMIAGEIESCGKVEEGVEKYLVVDMDGIREKDWSMNVLTNNFFTNVKIYSILDK